MSSKALQRDHNNPEEPKTMFFKVNCLALALLPPNETIFISIEFVVQMNLQMEIDITLIPRI